MKNALHTRLREDDPLTLGMELKLTGDHKSDQCMY